MNFEKFKMIRKAYAWELKEWMLDYEQYGTMHFDPYFFNWEFTPIEQKVWCDIRCTGIPFYPQLPALNYFLDFGNPFLKIGIECDGKAWHDKEKDRIRDKRLEADGWMIFRIEGHECVRTIEPETEYQEEPDFEAWRKYFMTTSEGIINAIRLWYFDSGESRFPELVESTLSKHRSTSYRDALRRVVKRHPQENNDDWFHQYIALIERRMALGA